MWELRRDALAFGVLRARLGGVSTSVLAQRLSELREEEVVQRDSSGRYRLSREGRELARFLYDLNGWAERRGRPPISSGP